MDESYIDRSTLAKNLQDLSKYKQIDPRLIKRLFINYHILLGEYYTEELEYNLKNISLSYVYNNFKKNKNQRYRPASFVQLLCNVQKETMGARCNKNQNQRRQSF